MTFLEAIYKNLDKETPAVALSSGSVFSYRDIAEYIADFQRHINANEKVLIIGENSHFWISAFLGTILKGSIAIPVDNLLTPEELVNIINDCKPSLIGLSSSVENTVLESLRFTRLKPKLFFIDSLKKSNRKVEFFKKEPQSPALILYTSGTTGNPKGVLLSFQNLNHNVQAIRKLGILNPDDKFLAILPFFHSYPLMATLIIPFSFSLTTIIVENLNFTEISESARTFGATVLVGVPKFFRALLHRIELKLTEFSPIKRILFEAGKRFLKTKEAKKWFFRELHNLFGKLRLSISGGAKLDEKVWQELELLGFEILEGYGLTETSPIVSVNTPEFKKIGSAGKPLDGVTVKISEKGEILVKGPNVMLGYYNREEETRKVLVDGWFHTGDLGYLDEDGFLYVTGRAKEVIVLESGKNIYPEDIETELLKSPYIEEAVVFYENSLKVLVKPNWELLKERKVESPKQFVWQEVKRLIKDFPPYKRPREMKITDKELPKTRLGKIKRFEIKKLWEEGS